MNGLPLNPAGEQCCSKLLPGFMGWREQKNRLSGVAGYGFLGYGPDCGGLAAAGGADEGHVAG